MSSLSPNDDFLASDESSDVLINNQKNTNGSTVVKSMVEKVNKENSNKEQEYGRKSESLEAGEPLQLAERGHLRVRATKTVSIPTTDGIEAVEEGVSDVSDDDEIHKGHHRRTSLTQTQYRLGASKPIPSNTFFSRLSGIVGFSTAEDEDGRGCHCCGFQPNRLVTSYLHWTFRNSFGSVFVSFSLGFFGLTLIFAIILLAAGYQESQCISVNGEYFSAYEGNTFFKDFGDAYALSWTTFSTVGYGLIFPSTSANYSKVHKCGGIFVLCTLESFIGILFNSFCGAIVYGKVARLRSHAQVLFSDAVVVRYGNGVRIGKEDDVSDNGEARDDQGNDDKLHLPVLEFRIANKLCNARGGEIMDCSMNIVAIIDESKTSLQANKATTFKRGRRGKRRTLRQVREEESEEEQDVEEKTPVPHQSLEKFAVNLRESAAAEEQQEAFEEDSFGKLMPRRMFSKIEVETPDHPFFKRLWTVRHTLDVESPILCEQAKQMVKMNNGYWPAALNDYESVKAAINLDQLLVSLSGTSNADANAVYAQKVYDYHDINIGYRFVNMLYRHEVSGTMQVDTKVINDVVEQAGGGGEPFHVREPNPFSDILVL
mmetsp:Transcript_1432/g.2124  ORF Transcript_1432/g.2124 Transcript_1432/m.2124 type:complete len:599 (-) Transcript_1432:326-2122(-)